MKSELWIQDLIKEKPVIAPSILAADFANLEKEICAVKAAGAKVLHIDVMDGHFVPNISIGIPVVSSLRKITDLKLDVHLMIENPEKYIEAFRNAGADALTIHIETTPNPVALLEKIRALGAAPGLAFNPNTSVDTILPWIDYADIILTMSVQPGFGGQAFRPEVLEKVKILRKYARPDTILSIDGGVNETTIPACSKAGIDLFVAGTAVFGASDYSKRIDNLVELAII